MADSYNELLGIAGHSDDANTEAWMPCQDDAASTTVDDALGGTDGTLGGGDNTSDLSTTGPNSWLTKAFGLDGSADYVDLNGAAYFNGAVAGIIAFRFKSSSTTRSIPFGVYDGSSFLQIDFHRQQFTTGSNGLEIVVRRANTSNDLFAYRNSVSELSDGNWHDLVVEINFSAGTVAVTLDGSDLGMSYGEQSLSTSYLTPGDDYFFGGNNNNGGGANFTFPGDLCGLVISSRSWTSGEKGQWKDGPEPVYSSGVSFGSDGAYNVGTWGLASPFSSGSNGTITYEIVAAKADGTVVDTASSSSGTLDLSSAAGETVYLLVRASNTGGYDIGDYASRTSSYGSSGDGYYELTSVVAQVTGTATPSTEATTCSGSGTVTPPAFTGTGDLATEAATTAGTGTSAVPKFAGSGTLATQAATADGSASSTPPAFSGSGTLATQTATAAGSGASSVPEFAGTGAVATSAATASGSGEASVPAFSGSGALLLEAAVAAAVGEAAAPESAQAMCGRLSVRPKFVGRVRTAPAINGRTRIVPAISGQVDTNRC